MTEADTKLPELDLLDLHYGYPGLTPVCGGALAEAASVCLEGEGHANPVSMRVRDNNEFAVLVRWQQPGDQERKCWNDDQEATELGACGIAAVALPSFRGLQIVQRSKKGTGFDYWLGSTSDHDLLFQNKARLEVSGIRHGSGRAVSQRIRQKLEQTTKSDGRLPAVVVVVEFSTPQTYIVDR